MLRRPHLWGSTSWENLLALSSTFTRMRTWMLFNTITKAWWRALRAVFNWVSKVISELLWFFMTSLSDWFKVLAPLFQPIRSETKANRGSRVHIFPRCRLRVILRVLIGLPDCLCPFWLAKVIALVLVLRHSFENRSNLVTAYSSSAVTDNVVDSILLHRWGINHTNNSGPL